jgi:hypothetical protein
MVSRPVDRIRTWLGYLTAWVGLGLLLVLLIGLWCLPAVVWVDLFHVRPRIAAYLTLAMIGVLAGLIALIGTQYRRLRALAGRLRTPRIPRASGYDRHAPA